MSLPRARGKLVVSREPKPGGNPIVSVQVLSANDRAQANKLAPG